MKLLVCVNNFGYELISMDEDDDDGGELMTIL